MSLQSKPFSQYEKGDRVSASDLNARGDLLSKIARSLNANGIMDSTGFLTRSPTTTTKGITLKLFRVLTEADGDGIYNCWAQTLDATDWTDASGARKLDDKDDIYVEVFNLAEFGPEATYVAHLVVGDRIVAWKMTDDESISRWVGIPIKRYNSDRPRMAYCKDDAGASNKIDCYLDTDATGTVIEVNCNISGALNTLVTSSRRLEDGDGLLVTKIQGTWWAIEGFMTVKVCDCYEEA